MNDFTKEELERILQGVSWWLDGDTAIYSESLINKIQSMIDNYCEHDTCAGEVEIFADTCSKCNALVLRDPHYE